MPPMSSLSSLAADAGLDARIAEMARAARDASLKLATVHTDVKNRAILLLAELIEAKAPDLRRANAQDLEAGRASGLSAALLDRLELTDARLAAMAEGARQVAALEDPVGKPLGAYNHPNGMRIEKRSVPLGVIGIVYESRPNVTIDCAVLCLKSGNASILRGGKEAFATNTALAALVARALEEAGLPAASVQLVPTTDRAALAALLKLDQYVQCLIPRGGEGLIRFVAENSSIPVIKHYKGVCTVYVDKAADADMAERLVVNAKCQRPSVCNAAENLLVHEAVATTLLPRVSRALAERGVELRAEAKAATYLEQAGVPAKPAAEADFEEEYVDRVIAIKVVASLEEAVAFVNRYGSAHSDAIVTADPAAAEAFLDGVDSATVYWNASTRFTDGYEFGLGAEIGISTDKLHARGPMGLAELCSYKYRIYGEGQIKE